MKKLFRLIVTAFLSLSILVLILFLFNYSPLSDRYHLDTNLINKITVIYMRTPDTRSYDISKSDFNLYIDALNTTWSKEINQFNLQKDDKLNYLGADIYIIRYQYANGKYFDVRTGDSRYKTIGIDMSNYFNDNASDYFYIHQLIGNSIFEEAFLEEVLIKASKSLK